MAVFFLLVGLEIKRELIVGELASVRKAALPIACAIGGMIVPAAFYWICNMSGPTRRGWGIPMATDIAFALGALALIAPCTGRRPIVSCRARRSLMIWERFSLSQFSIRIRWHGVR
jgi:NhaA family Na+:H+ antiporter